MVQHNLQTLSTIQLLIVFVNGYNSYLAQGKRFERYFNAQGPTFEDSCPVFAGRVNSVVTSKDSNYIFTVNDENNHIECWNSATGVKISSVCAQGPVTRLATQDGYVFSVSINESNQIEVFSFVCPYDPSFVATLTAAGPVRQLVVASGGCARVFATNSMNINEVEGWKHDGCRINNFDPLTFCSPVHHIAADENRVTVYGKDKDEDKMESYNVYCGDHESCFTIPKSVVTHLGSTDCGNVYAVFENAPNQVQKFDRCGGHAVAFKEKASGDISKMAVADDLIVTVSDNNIVDIFSADGCKISSVELDGSFGEVIFSNISVIDLVINSECDGSIYITMEALIFTGDDITNLNSFILKLKPDGQFAWYYQGRSYEVIRSLATSPNADYVFAVTEEDAIIAFDNRHGKRVGKFYGNAPISKIVAYDDAKVCFIYESRPSVVHVMDFCVPSCPETIGRIDVGDRVLHMLGTSSCHNKLLVVPACNSNQVYGWDVSHLNCEGEFNTLDGFDPLTVCEGPIDFLVSSAPSNFTLYREGYLTNYRFEDEGDVNMQFNLHEQITHLASTRCDRVFASIETNKKQIYKWCSEGGSSSTFCHDAQGPIAQLVATGKYVLALNNCADTVDIWNYHGSHKGSINKSGINDIAVNNCDTEQEEEECEGSVYLAHENHVILYSTDGDNETMFPQVSGTVTLIASNDDKALVFTANSDNNKIEAFTTEGVTSSHICASGPITQLVSKSDFVFAVNSSNPDQIEIFDFSCSHDPYLLDTVTAAGPIVQITASANGLELYATNSTNPKDIQGWSIDSGSCTPATELDTYNPFTLTNNMNLLAADDSVIAIFRQAS
ncbi:MAG: hypothetical protein NTU89_01265 [Candidatus Dependentiae bacterium]|nr:hypothetical protein [Candidatus Dependentiae bacterium]